MLHNDLPSIAWYGSGLRGTHANLHFDDFRLRYLYDGALRCWVRLFKVKFQRLAPIRHRFLLLCFHRVPLQPVEKVECAD